MKLTLEELSTILAALRFYQQQGQGEPCNRSDEIQVIADCDGEVTSLDAEGIDELCEKLNLAEVGEATLDERFGKLGIGG